MNDLNERIKLNKEFILKYKINFDFFPMVENYTTEHKKINNYITYANHPNRENLIIERHKNALEYIIKEKGLK